MKKYLLGAAFLLGLASPAFAADCSGAAITGMLVGNDGTTCTYIKVNTDGSIPVNAVITPAGTQDINIKQVNGTTILTGAGAVGTGSQRIAVGQDTTTIAGAAPGTTTAPSTNILSTVPQPSSAATSGIASVQSASVETGHVIKASAGNLYSFNVSVDSTLSASAWAVMIFNSTTVPAAGAVTPVKCYLAPIGTTSLSGDFATPAYFATGVSMAVSSGQTCFTKTDSAHGFISANVQ